MQQKELGKRQPERYAFPSAANSRNKILAINVAAAPTSCLLLLSYGVLTVTNPSRDALYKPVTMWPLSSAVICFQRISSTMPNINWSRARERYRKLFFSHRGGWATADASESGIKSGRVKGGS